MGAEDQKIPDEAGKHHTWKTSKEKGYKGSHRASDRKPEEDKDNNGKRNGSK